MSQAPAELWVSPGEGEYAGLWVQDGPGVDDEVRYVRADLYEALQARQTAALRRWPRVLALALTGGSAPTVTWREFCEAQDQFEEAVQSHREADYQR